MASKSRGGLSKREYAAKYGTSGGSQPTSGALPTIAPTQAGITSAFTALNQKTVDLANKEADLSQLPILLRQEFEKELNDSKLAKKADAAEQAMLSGFSEGMYKYKNISNPYQRRSLAEKYQGQLSMSYQALVNEKSNRAAKYADYIEKYTGLFSADIAKERAMLNAYGEQLSFAKGMWQENKADARAASSKAKSEDAKAFKQYVQDELASSVGTDKKADPQKFKELMMEAIRDFDYTQDQFMKEFGGKLSSKEQYNLGVIDERQYNLDRKASQELKTSKYNEAFGMTPEDTKEMTKLGVNYLEYSAYKNFKELTNNPEMTYEEYLEESKNPSKSFGNIFKYGK